MALSIGILVVSLLYGACATPGGGGPQVPASPHDSIAADSSAVSAVVPVVRATGLGYPPRHLRGSQARLMAERAAHVRAVRNLAFKLGLGRRARISGYRVVEIVRLSDGGYRVTVEKTIGR